VSVHSGPTLTTIVVTHDNADIVGRCLAAVRAAAVRHSQEIVVVDNASSDGTPEVARRAAPDAEVVELECNLGFAAANNVGIAHARGRLVALVNSDCFPDPGALDRLIDALDARPAAGLAGGRLRFDDGRHQSSGGALPTLFSELWLALGLHRFVLTERFGVAILWSPRLYERPRRAGWVSGAFCVARREIGPLPELGFMYGEDAAWAAQASARGYEAWLEPAAGAVHLGGASVARERAGYAEARSVEALLRWFGARGRGQLAAERAILCLHAGLRLAGATILLPRRRAFAVRTIRRYSVMLRAAARPGSRRAA
jgi:GT2 family glycosyltransferase